MRYLLLTLGSLLVAAPFASYYVLVLDHDSELAVSRFVWAAIESGHGARVLLPIALALMAVGFLLILLSRRHQE